MRSQPLVSVCIPSYNSEEFIAATLESVLSQKFADFEVVVADDKSTDGTIPVIKAFKDPRIRFVENEQNLGLGRNWNNVLSCARGEYVKLLGDDDVLYPECLGRQVEALECPANASAVLAICNRNVINGRNEIVMRRRFPFGPGLVSGRKVISIALLASFTTESVRAQVTWRTCEDVGLLVENPPGGGLLTGAFVASFLTAPTQF